MYIFAHKKTHPQYFQVILYTVLRFTNSWRPPGLKPMYGISQQHFHSFFESLLPSRGTRKQLQFLAAVFVLFRFGFLLER